MSIKIYSALNEGELTRYIYEFYFDYLFTVVGDSKRAEDVFEDMELFHPDIMVVGENIGNMALADFIKTMKERFEKIPYFVVMTDKAAIPELNEILSRFAVYYVCSNASGADIVHRIYDVACDKYYDFNLDKIQCTYVFEYLTKRYLTGYGIPDEFKGSEYLIKMITLIYRHFSYDNFDLEKLYSHIARKYNTTTFRISKRVRHLIELGWFLKPQLDPDNIYTSPYKTFDCKPTEVEFISFVSKLVHDSFDGYLVRNADKLSSESRRIIMEGFDDEEFASL